MTTVQLNASQLALDASSLGGLATRLRAAAESCESSLRGTTYMAGDDEAARVFAQGEGTDGQGYDEYAVSALKNVRLAADFVESLEAAVNNTGRVYDGVQLVGAGKAPESSGIAELRPSFGSPSASVPTSYGEGPQEPLGEFADFVLDKLREYGVPLPCADSGKLDSASSAWSSLQGGLVPIASSVRGDLGSVSGFRMPQQASIQESRDKLGNWIDELAESADGMRDYVDQMKQNVEQAWHEIRWFLAQMAIEIIAEIAIGAVLGAISFGAGAVAMTAKILVTVGKWVLKIVDKCKDLARIMRAIGSAAARIGNRLKGLLARAVNEAAAAGVASAGASFTVNQIRLNSGSEFDANYQAQDVWGNAAASAIGGGGGAIVGGAASAIRRGPNAGNLDGPDTFHGNVIGGIADGAFSTAAGATLFGEEGNYEGAMVLGALMGGGMHFLPGGGGGGHTSTPTSGNAGSPSQTTIPTPGGSGGPAPVTTASPGGVSVPGDGAPTPGSGGGGSNTSGGGSSVDVSNDAPTPGTGDAGTGGSDSGPSVEMPAAPDSSAPETSAPETSAPETSAPETSAPETSAPETSAPETSAPETSAPETSAPETSAPETSAPETSAPETSAPETSAPETSAPETSAPETSAPETSAPETSAPETSAPETSAPETSAPETSAPETSAPETSAPETSAPETSAPETSAPEASAPEAVPAAGGTGTSTTPASSGQDADAPAADDAAPTHPEAPATEGDDADADSSNDDAEADGDDVDAEAAAAAAVGGGAAAAVLAMQLPKPSTLSPTQGGKPGPATGADAGADSQAHGSSSNDSGSGDAPVAPDAPTSNTGDGSDGAADATAPVNPPTKLTLQQILDALKAINPNFDPLNPKSEYNNNCGNTSSILNDVLNGSPVTEAPTGTLSTPQMEARTGLPQTAMTPQQVIDSLVAQGAGSHCVVGVDRSTGAGHWFNAYFDGTTVWTLDAQNGTMTPFPPHEPNATNWDASIHPDHVAPVPPGVDSTAPDATTPAVDGDGSPKSGQPDATGRGESTDAPTTAAPDRPWTPEMGDPVFSGADNGPGWQRVPDRVTNPIDPSYGDVRAPGESGALADPYAHPGTVPAEIAHLITDPEAPYGRDTDGTPFSRTEWEARYTNADGRPIYPGNDGGTQGSFVEYHDMDAFIADYGSLLDRMGDPSGGFLSFPGTPFEMRSLPPSNLRDAYSIYEMGSRLPQGVRIEVSEIAPAFGRDGGGLQVRILGADGTPMTVDQLVLDRVLHRTEVDGANGRYTHGTPPAAPTAAPASGTGAPDVAPEAPARTGAPETSGPEAPTPVDAASEAGQAEGGTTASRETMRSIPTAATVDEAAAVVGENAAAIEPATTQLMQELAASVDGELAGLEFRLKAPDSLARKIASDAAVDGLTPAEAASAVSDALRYTIRTDAAGYTGAVRDTLSALRTQGWGVRVKNYWLVDSNPYQGVNVALTSPTGQRVELQFHTPESLALKEGRLHTLYEQYRVSTDAEVRARLNAEMFAAAADLAVPADVASISGAEADQPHTPPVTPPSRGAAPVAPSPRGSAAEHDSDGAAHEVDEPSDAADIDALLTSIDDELASNGLLTDAPLPDDVRADIERELRIDSASDGVTPASSLSTPNSSATEGLNGRELARALRDETPTPALRVMVNQGSPGHDPIYTNVSATTLEADHIHPLVQIVDMPGFRDLTWEQMLEVVNLADNFVGLEGGSNSSKGGRTFAEWFAAGGHLGRGPVPAHIVSAWSRIGQQAEAAVQAHIDELLRG